MYIDVQCVVKLCFVVHMINLYVGILIFLSGEICFSRRKTLNWVRFKDDEYGD